jgi:hypothetical protein
MQAPHKAKHIVVKEWVEESIREREDLDEIPFHISRYLHSKSNSQK